MATGNTTSVIIPCYNEENRLPKFLDELGGYLNSTKNDIEIVFVDDGSTDKTQQVIEGFNYKRKKLVAMPENQGKGAAIKAGIGEVTGDSFLFIDADGSIPAPEIDRMIERLGKYDVVVSSRIHDDSSISEPQPFSRFLVGKIFNTIANLFFRISVHDTLCGFKGFKSDVGKKLFSKMSSKRWAFDVELYYLVRKNGFSMDTLPIEWRHRPASKIKWYTPLGIFFELAQIRLHYFLTSPILSRT